MKISQEQIRLCREFLNIIFPYHAASCVRENVLSKSRKDGVSVIIPCFNEERYISRCADSVLAQHFSGELQVIFIDDGSTDGTGRMLDAYAGDGRVKVIHQENRGFSGVCTAVFYLLSGLIGESFPDCVTGNRFAGVLERAMRNGDYPMFKEGALILARADAARLL